MGQGVRTPVLVSGLLVDPEAGLLALDPLQGLEDDVPGLIPEPPLSRIPACG